MEQLKSIVHYLFRLLALQIMLRMWHIHTFIVAMTTTCLMHILCCKPQRSKQNLRQILYQNKISSKFYLFLFSCWFCLFYPSLSSRSAHDSNAYQLKMHRLLKINMEHWHLVETYILEMNTKFSNYFDFLFGFCLWNDAGITFHAEHTDSICHVLIIHMFRFSNHLTANLSHQHADSTS